MDGPVDLHLHTHSSDGLFSPTEVVWMARQAGVSAVAVTDHDTVSGLPEAREAAQRLGLRFIPAAELSVECQGQDIHILAYFLDETSAPLLAMLAGLRQARRERLGEILRNLHWLGLPLDEARVMDLVRPGAPVGRPHVADALVGDGWVSTHAEVFRYHLGSECPAYVPNRTPSPAEVLRVLLDAGAVPVLAHPGVYDLDRILKPFLDAGLMGLEVFHPRHAPEEVDALRRLAADLGLLETGGSDYHGASRSDVPPGGLAVSADLLERLEAAHQEVSRVRRTRHGGSDAGRRRGA